MKLVSFDEFIRMPAGTVFAPYEPMILQDTLSIKTDTGYESRSDLYPYDHYFNGVMPLDPYINMDAKFENVGDQLPASFEIYDGDTNDYRDYDKFLVFDESDIDRLINALVWAKNGCVGECDYCVEEDE